MYFLLVETAARSSASLPLFYAILNFRNTLIKQKLLRRPRNVHNVYKYLLFKDCCNEKLHYLLFTIS